MSNEEILRYYKKLVDILSDSNQDYDKFINVSKKFNSLYEIFENIDFTTFTVNELIEFGFEFWDSSLLLAPIWIILVSKEGTKFTSIIGNVVTKGVDQIDLESRFGSSAYGFLISDLRENKINTVLNYE